MRFFSAEQLRKICLEFFSFVKALTNCTPMLNNNLAVVSTAEQQFSVPFAWSHWLAQRVYPPLALALSGGDGKAEEAIGSHMVKPVTQ